MLFLSEFSREPGNTAGLTLPASHSSSGGQRWYRDEGTDRLPHEPDGFFTLRFPHALEEGKRQLSFFYEADRKTMTKTERIRNKLRADFHFVVREREKLRGSYQIDRIRAVLIETLDGQWALRLREAARHPVVSGGKP